LDTVQIKQCAREWREIDFQKVTSITLNKNRDAFINRKRNGDIRRWEDDRIECAEHFVEFIDANKKPCNNGINGSQMGLNDFTKQAIELLQEDETSETKRNLLNLQWNNHSVKTENLKKMIPIIDLSDSMEGEPLYAAIALAIRIAEKSVIGNRILVFGASSHWLKFEPEETFVEKVKKIYELERGTNANFYEALEKIIEAIIETKLSSEEIKDITLVILSDMQMDSSSSTQSTLYDTIREKYKKTGAIPHILFWNMRSTDGFPNLSNEANTSMVSGYNTSILDNYKETAKGSLYSPTPWSQFIKIMSKERYQVFYRKLMYNIS
jgi:hypothetical protein